MGLLTFLKDYMPVVVSSDNKVPVEDYYRPGDAAGEPFDALNAMPIYDGGAQITTATTTVVETGPCVLGGIQILAAVASTITIYDNTAASGTVIATLPASLAVGYYPINRLCAVGLTIVTAGASNLLVHTRKSAP